MPSGCLPLRKIEHTNNAIHKNLSLNKTQFPELFSRNQDTNFKPRCEEFKKKKVEKYNETILYWDGRQKQKHCDWNNSQLYQCRFQNNINSGQSMTISHIANLNNIKHFPFHRNLPKSQALFISFLTSQVQKSTTSYHLRSFTKTEKIVT